MHRLHSRNSWFYSMDSNMMVDFCMWTLQVDGLHVPPFDQHSDGDRSLRADGLTAEDWQSWLRRVIDLQDEQRRRYRRQTPANPFNPPEDLSSLLLPEAHRPPSAWTGNASVRDRLAELWEQYGPNSNQHARREPELTRSLHKAERISGINLYNELRPYHRRIPPLIIYLVEYEQPLDYLILPATLIMTVQEGQPEAPEFRERVLAAAKDCLPG